MYCTLENEPSINDSIAINVLLTCAVHGSVLIRVHSAASIDHQFSTGLISTDYSIRVAWSEDCVDTDSIHFHSIQIKIKCTAR